MSSLQKDDHILDPSEDQVQEMYSQMKDKLQQATDDELSTVLLVDHGERTSFQGVNVSAKDISMFVCHILKQEPLAKDFIKYWLENEDEEDFDEED